MDQNPETELRGNLWMWTARKGRERWIGGLLDFVDQRAGKPSFGPFFLQVPVREDNSTGEVHYSFVGGLMQLLEDGHIARLGWELWITSFKSSSDNLTVIVSRSAGPCLRGPGRLRLHMARAPICPAQPSFVPAEMGTDRNLNPLSQQALCGANPKTTDTRPRATALAVYSPPRLVLGRTEKGLTRVARAQRSWTGNG
uniref:Uncharacterized protein n=1 Tax=Pyricularia oryzae (strain P131) TaxID=1143193 RepID=L7JEF4_PYRO1